MAEENNTNVVPEEQSISEKLLSRLNGGIVQFSYTAKSDGKLRSVFGTRNPEIIDKYILVKANKKRVEILAEINNQVQDFNSLQIFAGDPLHTKITQALFSPQSATEEKLIKDPIPFFNMERGEWRSYVSTNIVGIIG